MNNSAKQFALEAQEDGQLLRSMQGFIIDAYK